MNSANQFHFCYFYIRQPIQAFICIAYIAIGIVLLIKGLLQYRASLRRDRINSNIKLTYACLAISIILVFAKIILSQIVFYDKYYDDDQTKQMFVASKYEYILQCSSIFVLQAAILLVPSNWLQNIIMIFKQISKNMGNTLTNQQRRSITKSIDTQQCSIKILTTYLIFRLICFSLQLIFMMAANPFIMITLSRISLIWMQIQSVFLLFMLSLGALSLKKNKILPQFLDDSDFTTMFRNYMLLILLTGLRLASDAAYTFFHYEQVSDLDNCKFEKDQISIERTTNILLQGFFTYYLIIIFILHIYKVEEDPQPDDLISLVSDCRAQSFTQQTHP